MGSRDTTEPVIAAWYGIDDLVNMTEVDGIPVVWSTMPGPLHAQLLFRVGSADEPFARVGLSHIVEHLTLSALDEVPYR